MLAINNLRAKIKKHQYTQNSMQLKVFVKNIIKIKKSLKIQQNNIINQFSVLLQQFSLYMRQSIMMQPFAYSIHNIQKYWSYLENQGFNSGVESFVILKAIKKYQCKNMNIPQRKCINCCQSFYKMYPISFHFQQANHTPYITLSQKQLIVQQMAKILSSLFNCNRGVVVIAGQFCMRQGKKCIQKGLSFRDYRTAQSRIQRLVSQAMLQIRQIDANIQIMSIPLESCLQQNSDHSKNQQYVIKIKISANQQFYKYNKIAYVQTKISHLKSLRNIYSVIYNNASGQFLYVLNEGQKFYEAMLNKFYKTSQFSSCICQDPIIKQKNKKLIQQKLPAPLEIVLKYPFQPLRDQKKQLSFMCKIFAQNQFQEQIPEIQAKQICSMFQIVNNQNLQQSIQAIYNLFKQYKICTKKYLPFLSLQKHLLKYLQGSNIIPYTVVLFIYQGKPNDIQKALKQNQISEKVHFIHSFITPKIILRMAIYKSQIDRLSDLIVHKYQQLPKMAKTEIKHPIDQNMASYNYLTLNFKQFKGQARKATIYTFLVLYFSKKRPKSDISVFWA